MSIEKKEELMDEEVILKDDEIKEMFDKEFDLADIKVSEDLIAKTMTAIRGLSDPGNTETDKTESYNTVSDNTEADTASDKVVSIANRKKTLKMVSGIAAALFVGFVMFAFIKMGVGGISKSEDRASEASERSYVSAQPNSVSEAYDYDGNSSTASAASPGRVADESEKCVESVDEPKLGMESSFESATGSENTALPQISAGSVTQDNEDGIGNTVKPDNDGKQKAEFNLTDLNDIKNYISTESEKITDSMNMMISPMKRNDKVIRDSDLYGAVTDEMTPVTEEALYALLKDSKDDPAKEYIYAVMLQDVSGINFTDENSENTWDTGKDYLKLYESAIANR